MDANEGDILESLLFSERKRKFAEALYALNPRNADNLIRWAEALLELSLAQNCTKSIEMKKDCISKLDKALSLNSENHHILYCLGNVYYALARSYPMGGDTSRMYFDMAYGYSNKALDKDPENKLYLKSHHRLEQNFGHYLKEMNDNNKDPKNTLYLKSKQKLEHFGPYFKDMGFVWTSDLKGEEEDPKNPQVPEPRMEDLDLWALYADVGESSGSSNPKAAKNPKSSNLMYEPYGTLGCVALAAVGIYALIHIAKSPVSPPPPR